MFYRHLLDAARADAGIESATLAAYTPLAFLDTPARRVAIEGYEPRRGEDLAFMSNTIGPDYFRTLRIALLAGREFEDRDDETAAPVAIVNSTLAQRFWGGAANAIGKRVRVGDGEWRTVIGVAADVKYARINEAPRPYVYLPFLQSYRSSMILHTRGAGAGRRARRPGARACGGARPAICRSCTRRPMADSDARRADALRPDGDDAVRLWRGRHGARRDGHLRARVVHRQAEHARNRHPHGARRVGRVGRSPISRPRPAARRDRRRRSASSRRSARAACSASVLFGVSATDAVSFARALAIVLGGVVVATLVPAWRAARTNPLSALRHQ